MRVNENLVKAIKFLTVDAIQKSNSGHPGMPLGMAELAVVLWLKHLKLDAQHANWPNRDRFVLSNGHGSMLLYSLLYFSGFDVTMDDIKNFRQFGSKTPGHPEHGITAGVETTTGPLGQGLANAVGFALAQKQLAATFNKPDLPLVDNYTFCFVGDGCLMEGISHEVCTLAGIWNLHKLIVVYDSNGISIDGRVENWHTEDTALRFKSYGWNVIGPIDGHDAEQIDQAYQAAKQSDKPTIIIAKTIIGHGSPNKQDTASVHGSPLGADEIKLMREQLEWTNPPFEIESDSIKLWQAIQKENAIDQDNTYKQWQDICLKYQKQYPAEYLDFQRRLTGDLPSSWAQKTKQWVSDLSIKSQAQASRKVNNQIMNLLAPELPELIGGSADLTASNLTAWKGCRPLVKPDFTGNYIYFGVREFGMMGIVNGMALYGGFIPFGATFLTFYDYCRNAIRMAALMKLRTIFIFSHDSIGLGEDGPTHQPIEQLSSLRNTPNLDVWRPAGELETLAAWQQALTNQGPTALVLSRQNIAEIDFSQKMDLIAKGAYLAYDPSSLEAIILANGTELELALKAKDLLMQENIMVRVVSIPSPTTFDKQNAEYKQFLLPPDKPVFAIEAGHRNYWCRYTKDINKVIGVDDFGGSAPADVLYRHFKITAQELAKVVKSNI